MTSNPRYEANFNVTIQYPAYPYPKEQYLKMVDKTRRRERRYGHHTEIQVIDTTYKATELNKKKGQV